MRMLYSIHITERIEVQGSPATASFGKQNTRQMNIGLGERLTTPFPAMGAKPVRVKLDVL